MENNPVPLSSTVVAPEGSHRLASEAGGAQGDRDSIRAMERWFLTACFAALVVLKLLYAFIYRVDSDEPQHLHVVWGWTQGLLPYRDFFDNHTPLFQALCSPLLKLLGERADILVLMRLAMIPIFAVCLLAVYQIAASLFSRRAGLWAAVLAGLWPNFLLTATEFRTDDLWVALWFVALALLLRAGFDTRRAFVLGLVFGTAFAVSMKTSLLVLALTLALGTALIVRLLAREKINWPRLGKWLAASLAGLVIVPAAVVLFFVQHGAWKDFHYCVITHNTLANLGKWHQMGFHTTWFPLSIPVMFFAAKRYVRGHPDRPLALRRALLFLIAGFYYYPMRSFWPLITRQDFLPLSPLLCIGLAVVILTAAKLLGGQHAARVGLWAALPALVAVGEIAWTFGLQRPWINKAFPFEQQLGVMLHVTNPGDMVLDSKGETIFRHRPFYPVLEGIMVERIRREPNLDDIPERLVATKTCVAITERMPVRGKAFIHENYVPFYGKYRVAGKPLGLVHAGQRLEFDVKIPARYALVGDGAADSVLDGKPYDAPRFLEAGPHTFQPMSRKGQVSLIWAQAHERGLGPANAAKPVIGWKEK